MHDLTILYIIHIYTGTSSFMPFLENAQGVYMLPATC